MAANPIPEAVSILEALQERWCVSTAGKDGARRIATFDTARGIRGEDDFDNEVFATRRCASDLAVAIERIRTLTAAQQQGAQEGAARKPVTVHRSKATGRIVSKHYARTHPNMVETHTHPAPLSPSEREAQQQGQAVAWIEPVAGTIRKYTPEQYESNKDMLHKHGWRPLVYGDTAPPPSAPDVICPNCDRPTEIRHCQACGCDFIAAPALAQQPAAVDEALSHADLCRLSRVFNANSHLGQDQDRRINDWLGKRIAALATQHQEPKP